MADSNAFIIAIIGVFTSIITTTTQIVQTRLKNKHDQEVAEFQEKHDQEVLKNKLDLEERNRKWEQEDRERIAKALLDDNAQKIKLVMDDQAEKIRTLLERVDAVGIAAKQAAHEANQVNGKIESTNKRISEVVEIFDRRTDEVAENPPKDETKKSEENIELKKSVV